MAIKTSRRHAKGTDRISDWKIAIGWVAVCLTACVIFGVTLLWPIAAKMIEAANRKHRIEKKQHPILKVEGKISVTIGDQLYRQGARLSDLTTHPHGFYVRLAVLPSGVKVTADRVIVRLESINNVKLKPADIEFDSVNPGETVRVDVNLNNLARDIKLVTLDMK